VIIAIKLAVIAVIGYLLGSIPFGLIISRSMAHVDIRKFGSGNIGATNVLRTLGPKLAVIVAILDLGKAALAVGIAMLIIGSDPVMVFGYDIHMQTAQVLAALAAIAGHNWSVFLKFKGGKGVATFMGGLFVINPLIALVGGVIGVVIALVTKYVSLGSILGSLVILLMITAFAVLCLVAPIYIAYALIAVGFIIYQHRTNIQRLQAGTELKLGTKGAKIDI
jgi:glycerol-3-phosphate acyltransferase PlsY